MTSKRTTLPKITRPAVSSWARRERIFSVLDKRNQQTLVWVNGPPGSGKSTLVAAYLESRERIGIWYHLDGSDEEPLAFYRTFGRAAELAVTGVSSALMRPTNRSASTEAFARRYFRELYEDLPPASVVVFDNFSESDLPWVAKTILPMAGEEAPEGLTLIVISRAGPPAALSGLIAKRKILSLDPELLCLTPEETKALAHSEGVTDEQWVGTLHQVSEGWAVAAVLLLTQTRLRRGAGPAPWGMQPVLTEYIRHQVFGNIDPPTQELLLRTALLPSVTPKQAGALGCGAESAAQLESLCRQHLLLTQCGVDEPRYRVHGLLREFLIGRMVDTYGAREAQAMRVRSAELLEQDGYFEQAMALYIGAAAWQRAVALLALQAHRFHYRGQGGELRRWIDMLPDRILATEPALLYWLGMCCLASDPGQGRAMLVRATALFSNQRDEIGEILSVAATADSYFLEWSDLRQIDGLIVELDRFLELHGTYLSIDVEVRILNSLLTAAIIRQPEHQRIASCAGRLMQVLASRRDASQLEPGMLVEMGTTLLRLARTNQESETAGQIIVHMAAVVDNEHVAPNARAFWELEYACYCANAGDIASAKEHFETAENIIDPSGRRVLLPIIGAWKIFSGCMDFGNCPKHSACSQHVATGNASGHNGLVAMAYGRAWMAAQHRRLDEALTAATTALGLAHALGDVRTRNICSTLVADLHYVRGEPGSARAHMEPVHLGATKSARLRIRHRERMLEAAGALATGDVCQARTILHSVLAEAKADSCPDLIRWPCIALAVYEFTLQQGIEVDYVRELVRQSGLLCGSQEVENWPWPIRVYTLGRFAVVLGAAPLRASGKPQRRQLSLLKFLIAQGGRDVVADVACEMLWPDSEGGAAHATLDSAVHRLRKLLGRDDAIIIQDGHLSLNPRVVWTDVWCFERLLGKSQSSPWVSGETQTAGQVQSLEAALRLYQGHFLGQDDEQAWMLAARAKLRSKWRRYLIALGSYWEEAGHFDKATTLYQHGLEIDVLAEELYQRLIKIYQGQGRHGNAMEAYRRCQHILSAMLGAKPSNQTEMLCKDMQAP
jgi:DNA-binding SARP family transcriptional activator